MCLYHCKFIFKVHRVACHSGKELKTTESKKIPPTVAPIRATNSSKGMLKMELSASHVSARALKGAVNIKMLAARNAVTGTPNRKPPCPNSSFNQLEQFDQNGRKFFNFLRVT